MPGGGKNRAEVQGHLDRDAVVGDLDDVLRKVEVALRNPFVEDCAGPQNSLARVKQQWLLAALGCLLLSSDDRGRVGLRRVRLASSGREGVSANQDERGFLASH